MQDLKIYKGWLIVADDTLGDDDCTKVGFDAFSTGDWKRGEKGPEFDFRKGQSVDVSPYSGTFDQCAALIDLEMLDRKDFGRHSPIRNEDIAQCWAEKFGDKKMPLAQDVEG